MKQESLLLLKTKLEKIYRECPLVPHTNAGRLSSTVRRMKSEKEMNIPIKYRSGFAVSIKYKKSANKLKIQEWNEFYNDLSKSLRIAWPSEVIKEPVCGLVALG